MKNRLRLRFRFAMLGAIALALCLLIPPGLSDSSPSLLKQLDTHYYFPQHLGLQRLSLRIHWAQLDSYSDSEDKQYLTNPPARFIWNKEDAEGRFELDDPEHHVSALRELEITRFLSNYREVFLPIPLQEKLKTYRKAGSRQSENAYEAHFVTREPNPVLQYHFKIDPKRWVIEQLHMQRERAPLQVTSRLRYVDRDGLWQVVESQSRFSAGGKDYQEILEFTYQRTGGFWLPTRIRQQLAEGNRAPSLTLFTLTNHRVN